MAGPLMSRPLGRSNHKALGVGASPEIVSDLRRNLAAAYTELGVQAHEQKQFELAVGHMGHACAFYPDADTRRNFGLAHAALAFSYMDSGKFEDAIYFFEHAEDAGIYTARLLNDYAVALANIGRIDAATVTFERALEADPADNMIRANLAALKSGRALNLISQGIQVVFTAPPLVQSHDYPQSDPQALTELNRQIIDHNQFQPLALR